MNTFKVRSNRELSNGDRHGDRYGDRMGTVWGPLILG